MRRVINRKDVLKLSFTLMKLWDLRHMCGACAPARAEGFSPSCTDGLLMP